LRIHLLAQEANQSGGAAVHTAELCRQMAKRGQSVTLICHAAEATLDALAKAHRLPRPAFGNWPALWRFAMPLRLVADYFAPPRLPLEHPDVAVVSDLPLWWMHRRRFPRVPFVYLPHALVAPMEVETYPFRSRLQKHLTVRSYAWLERRALNEASTTVRFTQTACEAMREYHGSKIHPRFEVLPAPVPIPDTTKERHAPGPIRLLSLGRLVETKNVSLLFRMLAPLSNLAWALDIVGDGEARNRLEAEAQTSGFGERIKFHGQRTDVDFFYRRADLFLLPSKLENAPLVLLEAMSHGLPALSIRADGKEYRNANHEIIELGRTGFLARDEPDFAAILAELLGDPERLNEVGTTARQVVIKRHRWDDYTDRMLKLLTRCGATTR
jgi:glycosyltransferase involved in cell wall biosynthesis